MKVFLKRLNNGRLSRAATALVLAFAVILTAVSGMFVTASSGADIWDGSSVKPTAGSGTEQSPYEISAPEHLAWAVTNKDNYYYKLTADIYLNDVSVEGWENGSDLNEWVSLAKSDANPFVGHIDGDGHVVFGVWYPAGGNNETAGLIPNMKAGSVKNIGVRYSVIRGTYAGGIIGYTNMGGKIDIDRCFTDETVTVAATNSAAGIHGGINTNNEAAKAVTISNTYTSADISSSGDAKKLNGIIGDIWKSYIIVENCYSYGIAPFYMGSTSTMSLAYQNGGALTGTPLDEVLANVYSDTEPYDSGKDQYTDYYNLVDSGSMLGNKAAESMSGLDFETVFETVGGRTPKLQLFPDEDPVDQKPAEPEPEPGDEAEIWDGTTASGYSEGSGTADDPYIIKDGSELRLAVTTQNAKIYYKLANDIYLNDVSTTEWYKDSGNNEWVSSGEFRGRLDGDGHVVFGIWYPENKTDGTSGLVPKFHSGSISNIGVRYSQIRGNNAGGIVGYNQGGNTQTIENCFTDETVSVIGNASAAGIHGGVNTNKNDANLKQVKVTISNCYTTASVGLYGGQTNRKVNGIIGDIWKSAVTVQNCYSYGSAPYYMATESTMSCLHTNGVPLDEVLTNVYSDKAAFVESDSETYLNNHTVLAADDMIGDKAAESMSGLDFDTVFETVEGKTPKLQIFPDEDPVDQKPGEPDPEDPDGVWDGTSAKPAAGSGTEESPYEISAPEHLAWAVTNKDNNYYKLTADIYLNDVSVEGWENGSDLNEWVSLAKSDANPFVGHIDGDGHVVFGVWYPAGGNNETAGLIPNMKAGSVKNIGVRYSVIRGTYAGGIIGYTNMGGKIDIDRCFTDETVTVAATNSAAGIHGGINTNNEAAKAVTISNTYTSADISSSGDAKKLNGIIGDIWKSYIIVENCYSYGIAPFYMGSTSTMSLAYQNGGALTGTPLDEVLANVYSDTEPYDSGKDQYTDYYNLVDSGSMLGNKAAESMSGLDFETVFETVGGRTPKLQLFPDEDPVDQKPGEPDPDPGEDDDDDEGGDGGASADGFAGGDGSKSDPYIIKTVEHLRYLVESKNTAGNHYELANDIYVNDTSDSGWKDNNPAVWYNRTNDDIVFSGSFDGRGHTVYGLYVNIEPDPSSSAMSNDGTGLFPVCDARASIMNVHIRDSYISGKSYVGSVAGRVKKYNDETELRIIGCSADGTVELHGQSTGGIVGGGNSPLNMQYCYFTGTLTSTANRASGLVGDIWTTKQKISQCYSIGYKNFRENSSCIPATVLGLYGTVAQSKTVVLEAEAMYGAAARDNMIKFDWNIWSTVEGGTPHMRVIEAEDILDFNASGTVGQVWSGMTASGFAGGTGTETDPYIIETPEQLAYMISQTGESEGKHYKITADIKLNDTSVSDWTSQALEWVSSNGEWAGHIDGDGHVISGLYFNASDAVVGLLQKVVTGAVIEKLGITDSYIVSKASSGKDSYAAAFIGQTIGDNSTDNKDTYVNPVMSQCFADDSVYIEAKFAGGLVAGNPRALSLDNCYFSGELSGDSYAGTLIGNTWNGYVSVIENCYSVSLDRDPIMENSGAANAQIINSYIDGNKGKVKGISSLGIAFMKGEQAKTKMAGFDFDNIWMTVEDGSPVLRCFENAEQYSSHHDPYLLELSFASEGGSECESLFGFAGQELDPGDLPVPVYRGYRFDGWYTSSYKIIPYTFNYFPDYEMVLYAKWTQVGFEQGFESLLDEMYDYNIAFEQFRPGNIYYTPKNLHGGNKSMHAIAGLEETPLLLLNYENPLVPGNEYEMIFWIGAETAGASGSVELLAASDPHIYSNYGDITSVGYSNLGEYEWREFTVKFVADAPYVLVRVNSDTDLYLDDFSVVPTGKTGTVKPLVNSDGNMSSEPEQTVDRPESGSEEEPTEETVNNETSGEKSPGKPSKSPAGEENGINLVLIIAAAAGALVVIAAVVTTVIIVKKRKKNKK